VQAIASRDPDRAKALADAFDIPVVHHDYAALLADPAIDAVYVPLPNSAHHPWTLAAAAAGKHILCEKPLALTAVEAEAMVGAAARAGVVLAEAFAYRFHPRIGALLQLLRAGDIGDLHLIRFSFTFRGLAADNIRLVPSLGGGALMDVGCYGVNLARLIAGSEPEVVTALAQYGAASGVDETFVAVLRFAGGMLATLEVSLVSQFGVSLEVLGSTGRLVVPDSVRAEPESATELQVYRDDTREVIRFEPADPYRLMVEDFADAVRLKRPVRFEPADAVANMRVLDALRTAARTRHPA
jgi:predicted dehydrogenase